MSKISKEGYEQIQVIKNALDVMYDKLEAKKVFSEVSENNNPLDRVSGTCATSTLGVMASINIFRVHDVWQNKQAIDVAFAIKNI